METATPFAAPTSFTELKSLDGTTWVLPAGTARHSPDDDVFHALDAAIKRGVDLTTASTTSSYEDVVDAAAHEARPARRALLTATVLGVLLGATIAATAVLVLPVSGLRPERKASVAEALTKERRPGDGKAMAAPVPLAPNERVRWCGGHMAAASLVLGVAGLTIGVPFVPGVLDNVVVGAFSATGPPIYQWWSQRNGSSTGQGGLGHEGGAWAAAW